MRVFVGFVDYFMFPWLKPIEFHLILHIQGILVITNRGFYGLLEANNARLNNEMEILPKGIDDHEQSDRNNCTGLLGVQEKDNDDIDDDWYYYE